MASYEADGAAPSGVDLRVARPLRIRAAVGFLLAGAAVVALSAGIVKPGDKASPSANIHAAIKPEALAGPSPAAETGDSKQVLQGLLAKAGLRPDFGLRRLTWDQARRLNAVMPQAAAAPDAAKPFVLPTKTKDGRQALTCLTQAAYYEAGANGQDAEAAVVQVVLNRVRHPDFPKSVCGVVYQGAERQTGCQFTFTCDGALDRPIDKAAWDEAGKVAARALAGYVVKAVGAATYYHADYVFPAWAPTLQKIATVGPHIFYRLTGAEGAASFLTGRYAGGELKLTRAILKATDRFTQTGERGGKAQVTLASNSVAPAAAKAPADRLQRVHDVFPVSQATTAQPQTTPAPADTPTASAVSAPVAETADVSAPAA
jgi:spore germination cell wall hydrolase CwlJ-like protein